MKIRIGLNKAWVKNRRVFQLSRTMKEAHLLHRVCEDAKRPPDLKIADGVVAERGQMRRCISVTFKGKTRKYFVKPTDDQDIIERKIDQLAAELQRKPSKVIDVGAVIKKSKVDSEKLVLDWLDQ